MSPLTCTGQQYARTKRLPFLAGSLGLPHGLPDHSGWNHGSKRQREPIRCQANLPSVKPDARANSFDCAQSRSKANLCRLQMPCLTTYRTAVCQDQMLPLLRSLHLPVLIGCPSFRLDQYSLGSKHQREPIRCRSNLSIRTGRSEQTALIASQRRSKTNLCRITCRPMLFMVARLPH